MKVEPLPLTIFFLIFFLTSFYLTRASTTLSTGSAQFFISDIVLYPVDDYTHTEQYLGLFGNTKYLNVFWDAEYEPTSTDPIGVECWLNCPYTGGKIENVCKKYQNCTFVGATGQAVCTIENPKYDYKKKNSVICKFYNPNYPDVEYLPYPNRTFYLFYFTASAAGGVFTVGETRTWPIRIVSYSFITSNYTVNLTTTSPYIIIENQNPYTEEISYGETSSVNPRLTFTTLVNKATIRILIRPVNDPTTCASDSDCSQEVYGTSATCFEGVCWKEYDLTVNSGYASMPEYGIKGLIELIVLALSAFVLIVLKR